MSSSEDESDGHVHGEGDEYDDEYIDESDNYIDEYGDEDSIDIMVLINKREKVDWSDEMERKIFLIEAYPLIEDWRGRYPKLRYIFAQEEIDWILMEAVKSEHVDGRVLIDFILKTGYRDKPKVDKDGKPLLRQKTPLHLAASDDSYDDDSLDQLFEIFNRFDVNYVDEDGLTHFHIACQFGCEAVVKKFLELGQDPNCLEQITTVSPPLHLALERDQDQLIDLLLRNGANPNLADQDGCTPLHVICSRSWDDEVVETFFKINDDIQQTVQIDARDKRGDTPLQLALAGGHKKVARFLLSRGADPNSANEEGLTALHTVCKRDIDEDLMEIFFEIDEDEENQRIVQIDAVDNLGRTPLQWAALKILPRAVDVLLNHDADLSGFVFPTESDLSEKFAAWRHINCKLIQASGLLAIAELLENRGYKLDLSDALTIMQLFAKYSLFEKSKNLEMHWYADEKFATVAKEIMIIPNLSMYHLIALRPEEAEKRLTFMNYLEFWRSTRLFKLSEEYQEVCDAHLCEKLSKRFCRRWARDSFLKLIRYRLPILCCDVIIKNLMNEDLLRICLADANQNPEDSNKNSTKNTIKKSYICTYEDYTHGFLPCIIEASAAAAVAAVASTHARNIARYCHRRHSASSQYDHARSPPNYPYGNEALQCEFSPPYSGDELSPPSYLYSPECGNKDVDYNPLNCEENFLDSNYDALVPLESAKSTIDENAEEQIANFLLSGYGPLTPPASVGSPPSAGLGSIFDNPEQQIEEADAIIDNLLTLRKSSDEEVGENFDRFVPDQSQFCIDNENLHDLQFNQNEIDYIMESTSLSEPQSEPNLGGTVDDLDDLVKNVIYYLDSEYEEYVKNNGQALTVQQETKYENDSSIHTQGLNPLDWFSDVTEMETQNNFDFSMNQLSFNQTSEFQVDYENYFQNGVVEQTTTGQNLGANYESQPALNYNSPTPIRDYEHDMLAKTGAEYDTQNNTSDWTSSGHQSNFSQNVEFQANYAQDRETNPMIQQNFDHQNVYRNVGSNYNNQTVHVSNFQISPQNCVNTMPSNSTSVNDDHENLDHYLNIPTQNQIINLNTAFSPANNQVALLHHQQTGHQAIEPNDAPNPSDISNHETNNNTDLPVFVSEYNDVLGNLDRSGLEGADAQAIERDLLKVVATEKPPPEAINKAEKKDRVRTKSSGQMTSTKHRLTAEQRARLRGFLATVHHRASPTDVAQHEIISQQIARFGFRTLVQMPVNVRSILERRDNLMYNPAAGKAQGTTMKRTTSKATSSPYNRKVSYNGARSQIGLHSNNPPITAAQEIANPNVVMAVQEYRKMVQVARNNMTVSWLEIIMWSKYIAWNDTSINSAMLIKICSVLHVNHSLGERIPIIRLSPITNVLDAGRWTTQAPSIFY
ncbi:unnamed protein product [Trichogramma brassicae]|uniref:Uncharacterized protein n=1 Tax=Trichogramma brassicae TaxID=86971 RepID=A0A6H5HWV8_9HYME|nr:unnamed protein product [Trichogramma brassicae]